ncbi:hypothetical protein [Stutzerimonas kunmingensis]|uniref:hypothetical protein n=1 Tax=Stutzerimonas kunmingensis TaxID=1211807 RepID=UPI00241D11B9|nr:hypothetical protein [Stutzerimonas kunmingensis]
MNTPAPCTSREKNSAYLKSLAGRKIGGSNIITQAIKSPPLRASIEGNVITLAITSRQQTPSGKAKEACKYIKNQRQVRRRIRALLPSCEPLA